MEFSLLNMCFNAHTLWFILWDSDMRWSLVKIEIYEWLLEWILKFYEVLVDENGGACRLIFMQERRGYKEKWWRKERTENSFRNAFRQLAGQLSVSGRPADCQPTGDRTSSVPFPECHIFQILRCRSGDRTTLVPIPEAVFPVSDESASSRSARGYPTYGWLADSQSTGDRTSNLAYFGEFLGK